MDLDRHVRRALQDAAVYVEQTMSRTLLLLRHAKSDYPTGVPDHERPLAPRGIREAALAGDWIRANAPAVDAVLCSTATRTRQTLAHTGIDAPVEFVDRLYDSTPGTVIDVDQRGELTVRRRRRDAAGRRPRAHDVAAGARPADTQTSDAEPPNTSR